MKLELAPSILSFDPGRLSEGISACMAAGVDWIHLDVMDGQFVPPITFGADLAASAKKLGSTPIEAHLMTLTPERHFEGFIAAGCERVIFHAEATPHAHRLCQALRKQGVQAGVAINPGTPVEALSACLPVMDLALVMTVNPGWGGQAFIHEALVKVAEIRKLAPRLPIQVDGGIDPTTLPLARNAGATVFVAGSYLTRAATIDEGIAELRAACG